LTRLWKILLTGLDDVRNAPDPLAAADMTVLRLAAAASLPGPEEAARILAAHPVSAPAPAPGGEAPGKPEPASMAPADAMPVRETSPVFEPVTPPDRTQPEGEVPMDGPATFEALIELLREKRDIALQTDVERCGRPAGFTPGSFTYPPTENGPSDLAQRLAKRLLEWTGARWAILASTDVAGEETWAERRRREDEERLERARRDPAVAEALRLFPGAEIVAVRESAPSGAASDDDRTTERRA